jgi:hypothetical protein
VFYHRINKVTNHSRFEEHCYPNNGNTNQRYIINIKYLIYFTHGGISFSDDAGVFLAEVNFSQQ